MVELLASLAKIRGIADDGGEIFKKLLPLFNEKALRQATSDIIDLVVVLLKQFSSGDVSLNVITSFVEETGSKMKEALSKCNHA